ncbi:MAG TPA: response regulator [Bryobacteraceae bacterium]|nr:response regulator [Bryobacteraceae bacterium]
MSTILIVEDNAVTRQIMRLSLAAQGYEIIEAEDGAAAISKMAECEPALVIQDLALPDIDGLSLAQALRSLPGREDIPIVAFSAFLDRLEEARATNDIFRAFVPKPIEPSKLVSLVKRLLSAPVAPVPGA